jgi:hypothetical protein
VLRHDHIADNDKTVTLPRLLENFQEAVTRFSRIEERQSPITRAGDKLQMVSAVSTMQAGGHGKPMVSAASFPPLQKTQGRGTHSFGTGKEEPDAKGWATRRLFNRILSISQTFELI